MQLSPVLKKNRFLVAESVVYSFKKTYTFICNKICVTCLPTGLYEPELFACIISLSMDTEI